MIKQAITHSAGLTCVLAAAVLCLPLWPGTLAAANAVSAQGASVPHLSSDNATDGVFADAHAARLMRRHRLRHRPSPKHPTSPRVVLTYTPDRQGLFNQHYSHYMAMLAASSLRCDVVFASRAYSRPQSMTGAWMEHAASVFYNVTHVEASMRALGVRVLHRQPDGLQDCVLNLTTPHPWHYRTPPQLRHEVEAVVQGAPPTCSQVVVHIDRVFSSLQPHLFDTAAAVINAVRFHDRWHQAAVSVLASLPPDGFNAVHLRIEPDATTWFGNTPFTMDMYWPMYFDAASVAGFGPDKLLYVAGGLLDDAQATLLDTFVKRYASTAVAKETATGDPALAAHPVDQQAIIDYLVMLHADGVVGHPFSTFSLFLKAERSVRHQRGAFFLIDAGGLMASLNPTQHAQNVACFDIVRG